MSTKIIYGIHAVMAALNHQSENVLELFCVEKEDNTRHNELLTKAKMNDLTIQYISTAKLEKLTQSTQHQGVAVKVRVNEAYNEKDLFEWLEKTQKKPLLLILEGIQDPHNLGACLRSACAFGVDWVILPKVNTAPLGAVVSKVSCGADQILSIVEVSNLVRTLEKIKSLGVWVVGTTGAASKTLKEIDAKGALALVMGTEGTGLKQLTLKTCDEVIKIPMQGEMPSVNVSVATGICLYEVARQRA